MKATDLDPRSVGWDALSTLLGAYLHQDFAEEHGSAWGAVRDFSSQAALPYVLRAAEQIRALLRFVEDEQETRRALERLGIDYMPSAEGWTYRAWLAEVEDVLRAEPDRRS